MVATRATVPPGVTVLRPAQRRPRQQIPTVRWHQRRLRNPVMVRRILLLHRRQQADTEAGREVNCCGKAGGLRESAARRPSRHQSNGCQGSVVSNLCVVINSVRIRATMPSTVVRALYAVLRRSVSCRKYEKRSTRTRVGMPSAPIESCGLRPEASTSNGGRTHWDELYQ